MPLHLVCSEGSSGGKSCTHVPASLPRVRASWREREARPLTRPLSAVLALMISSTARRSAAARARSARGETGPPRDEVAPFPGENKPFCLESSLVSLHRNKVCALTLSFLLKPLTRSESVFCFAVRNSVLWFGSNQAYGKLRGGQTI